jgi:PRTRC genetic system protein A
MRDGGGHNQVSSGEADTMDTNLKDRLVQERFPTVMVPRFGQLSPCPLYQTRFLIARGGLYIDTSQPFGAFRRCLWFSDRDLPYGEIAEVDDFSGILKDPQVTAIFEDFVLPLAAEYAGNNLEWAGWVIWTKEERYSYLPLDFEASAASILIKERPLLPQNTYLALDVHSHGAMKAFFSLTDDCDDSGGVRLSVVLGDYSRNDGRHHFVYKCRVVVEGFFFDLEVGE